jgi:uncharacterized protein (TIGR02145 family)
MKTKRYFSPFLALVGILLFVLSCEREFTNPWDEKSTLDPNAWAPKNLQITDVSITEKKLTWTYSDLNIEGFKIDRKENNGSWVISYATLNPNQETFSDNVSDLWNNTYSYRVYAFAGQYESQKVESLTTLQCGIPFTDTRDGTQYETIEIGTQCWMKQNLAYIPSVSPPSAGSQTSSYFYVYGYSGNSVSEAKTTSNYQTYGVLYNWPASIIACPQGWHLPSDSEGDILVNYLGGSSVAGGKMKEAGTVHWSSPNTGATNNSEFTALPGGNCDFGGYFNSIGDYGSWWSSTEYSSASAWLRNLSYNGNGLYGNNYGNKEYGFSVRCLRDE